MKPISCPNESRISNAARTGCWDDLLKAHVKECLHCRETASIVESLRKIAAKNDQSGFLPDPEQVFLNAKIAAMQARRETALHPLMIAELAVKVAVALALAIGIVWVWFGAQSLALNSLPLLVPKPVLICAASLGTGLVALLFTKLAQPMLFE